MEYIRTATEADADECIFCSLPAAGDDEAAHVLRRGELAFVVLNAFPYNPGHLMVAPLRHTGDFEDLAAEEADELTGLQRTSMRALREEMAPHGFNVGMNIGKVAGAGFPGHLHWHIVPRWNGDTNFMPVFADTRVIVQSLDALYDLLREELTSARSP